MLVYRQQWRAGMHYIYIDLDRNKSSSFLTYIIFIQVDVDILFTENATIGQRIALSE